MNLLQRQNEILNEYLGLNVQSQDLIFNNIKKKLKNYLCRGFIPCKNKQPYSLSIPEDKLLWCSKFMLSPHIDTYQYYIYNNSNHLEFKYNTVAYCIVDSKDYQLSNKGDEYIKNKYGDYNFAYKQIGEYTGSKVSYILQLSIDSILQSKEIIKIFNVFINRNLKPKVSHRINNVKINDIPRLISLHSFYDSILRGGFKISRLVLDGIIKILSYDKDNEIPKEHIIGDIIEYMNYEKYFKLPKEHLQLSKSSLPDCIIPSLLLSFKAKLPKDICASEQKVILYDNYGNELELSVEYFTSKPVKFKKI